MNEFTLREALELLLRRTAEFDPDLGASIRAAIDAGRETHKSVPRRKGAKSKTYRQVERLTDAQALEVALNVINSYTVELPSIANAALEDLEATRREQRGQNGPGVPDQHAQVQLEMRTETQISDVEQETVILNRTTHQMLSIRKRQIERIRTIIQE